MKRWTCSVCHRRYTRLATHVWEWHGWPYSAKSVYEGGPWLTNPLPMERLIYARPQQAWRFCPVPA